MIAKNTNYEKGSAILTILLIIMVVVIGFLIYLLAGSSIPKTTKTVGVESPTMEISTSKTENEQFSDGLTNLVSSKKFNLNEFGEGIAEQNIYEYDINNDGKKDRITRTKNENGTPHFYYEYKIELNKNGSFVDITPEGFRTTEGAECALQKLQFVFKPDFKVIKISRDWKDSWDTPSLAIQTTYNFSDGKIISTSEKELQTICDVSELF